MTPALLGKILCCIPRGDAATRALISAALAAYGFGEDKSWAKWFGVSGLVLTGLAIGRCYFQLGQADAAGEIVERVRRKLVPAAASDAAAAPDLRLVPADMEPA